MSTGSNRSKAKRQAKRHKTAKAQRRPEYGNAIAASSWTADDLDGLRWAIAAIRQQEKKTATIEHVCPKCGERSEVKVEIEIDDLRAAAGVLEGILAGVGQGASRWFGGQK